MKSASFSVLEKDAKTQSRQEKLEMEQKHLPYRPFIKTNGTSELLFKVLKYFIAETRCFYLGQNCPERTNIRR